MAIGVTRIPIGFNKGFSWQSYWEKQSDILFFGEISQISSGKLYNQVVDSSDYLTVAGSPGSYTFQCPQTDAYKNADTDFIWIKQDGITWRTTTELELISYDFPRTLVNYDGESPYTLRSIMILGETKTLSESEVIKITNNMRLSPWWNGIWVDAGEVKENRAFEQSLWTPESLNPNIPTDVTAVVVLNSDTVKLDFTDHTGGIAQHEIVEAIGAGSYTAVTTLAAGVTTYTYATWQGTTMNFKVRAVITGPYYSNYTTPTSLATPLVFKTNQTTLTNIVFSTFILNGGSNIVHFDWGDGTSNDYVQGQGVGHTYTVQANPYYIQISGHLENITSINHNTQSKSYGSFAKWIMPSALQYLRLYYDSFTGDWSTFQLTSTLLKINLTAGGGGSQAITAPPRGDLRGLDSTDGMYMPDNACNTTALDAFFVYANAFYASNTPIKNTLFELTGATMGIPTGGNSNTDIVAIKAKFTAAGFTATIHVRTS